MTNLPHLNFHHARPSYTATHSQPPDGQNGQQKCLSTGGYLVESLRSRSWYENWQRVKKQLDLVLDSLARRAFPKQQDHHQQAAQHRTLHTSRCTDAVSCDQDRPLYSQDDLIGSHRLSLCLRRLSSPLRSQQVIANIYLLSDVGQVSCSPSSAHKTCITPLDYSSRAGK